MDTITFDNLITQSYLTTFEHEVAGVGSVTIHQQSAKTVFELTSQLMKLEGAEQEIFLCGNALEFVKGSKPTAKEIESFRLNLSAKQVSAIYTAGIESVVPAPNLEAVEKK